MNVGGGAVTVGAEGVNVGGGAVKVDDSGVDMFWLNQNEAIPAYLMKGQGIGEKQPIAYNTMPDGSDNPAGRAQNRRVEIRFAPN